MRYILLDDLRTPSGWEVFRPAQVQEFLDACRDPQTAAISFDNDLGLDENGEAYPKGKTVLVRLEREVFRAGLWADGAPQITVHSGNLPAAKEMEMCVRAIYRICGRKPLDTSGDAHDSRMESLRACL